MGFAAEFNSGPDKEGSMNIFKSFRLEWWQASLFKISLTAFGIAVGSTWPDVFTGWIAVIWVVFLVTGAYITYVWWRQVRA
jgi:hypothetical protein